VSINVSMNRAQCVDDVIRGHPGLDLDAVFLGDAAKVPGDERGHSSALVDGSHEFLGLGRQPQKDTARDSLSSVSLHRCQHGVADYSQQLSTDCQQLSTDC
jgi:hypothetical protein